MGLGFDEFFHLRTWMDGKASDEDFTKWIRTALSWLAVPGRDAFLAEVDLHNLALGYSSQLEERLDGGSWKQVTEQLSQVEASARNLARDLQALELAAQSVLLKEACVGHPGLFEAADISGLFGGYEYLDEPGSPRITIVGNQLKVEQNPNQELGAQLSSEFRLGRPLRPLGPEWIIRVEALATACHEGARIARVQTNIGGRRKATDRYFGTPEMQLMTDCAALLKKLGRDESKAYRLAKATHQLVSGEIPKRDWASEAKRIFVPWWTQVGKWWGNEAKAPKRIQEKIKNGPQGEPRRPSRN